MKSNEELYAFVAELIIQFEAAGDFERAKRLRNALHISSVITEVFMALRQELAEVLDSPGELDPMTRKEIRESIRAIGSALR